MGRVFLIAVLGVVLGCATARSGDDFKSAPAALPENPFTKGAVSLETMAGTVFSIDSGASTRPTINYAVESLRYGIMLTNPRGSGFFAGNVELLVEGYGAEVYTGPGSVIAGATLLFRYNFVHPDAAVIPYFQVGGGGAYNDIYQDQAQTLAGSKFEFNLQGSLGLRFPVTRHISILIEENYRHISNGGLANRNTGLDAFGGMGGVAFSF